MSPPRDKTAPAGCQRQRQGRGSFLSGAQSLVVFTSHTSVLIPAGLLANNMPLTLNITITLLLTAAPLQSYISCGMSNTQNKENQISFKMC